MSEAEDALLTVVAPQLKAAGYSRRGRVWSRTMPETVLIVEVLCQSGPLYPACCTIDFGVLLGRPSRRLDIASAVLRERWGRFLTVAEPWTDRWVGFDTEGPYLTTHGKGGERLDADALRKALAGRVISTLERCSTLSAIEAVFRARVDLVTGSKLEYPGADAWCERSLAELVRQRSAPCGRRQGTTSSVEDLVGLIHVELAVQEQGGPDIPAGNFVVTFGDGLAHGYEEDVAASVELVPRTPGVRSAGWADREVIAGWGEPDLKALEDGLRAWWRARLWRDE
jgi:hypothetical protein